LNNADCVVIVTDHTSYDWQHIVDQSKLVVDTRNALAGVSGKARVVTL
jgi:UDP-N-acetyl-D-glucosamine dehydrogenase